MHIVHLTIKHCGSRQKCVQRPSHLRPQTVSFVLFNEAHFSVQFVMCYVVMFEHLWSVLFNGPFLCPMVWLKRMHSSWFQV